MLRLGMRTSSVFNSQHVATRCNRVAKRVQYVKALANKDTLLQTHCCPHKCCPVCPHARHLFRTQILCPGHKKCFWFCLETVCVRNKCFPVCAAQETSWATVCPQQCVLVYQGLYTQQCCHLLRSNVGIVWPELANPGPAMLEYVALRCRYRLAGTSHLAGKAAFTRQTKAAFTRQTKAAFKRQTKAALKRQTKLKLANSCSTRVCQFKFAV